MRDKVLFWLKLSIKLELDGWRSLFLLATKRVAAPAHAKVFSHYLELRTLLFIFIGLSAVEIPIFDLILSRWPAVRWPMLALGIWGLTFMIGLYAGLRVHPHYVTDDELVVRSGSNFEISIPKSNIYSAIFDERNYESSKGFQLEASDEATSARLVTMSQTNIDLVFKRPILVSRGQRSHFVTELSFFADDAKGLVEAL